MKLEERRTDFYLWFPLSYYTVRSLDSSLNRSPLIILAIFAFVNLNDLKFLEFVLIFRVIFYERYLFDQLTLFKGCKFNDENTI